VQHPVDRIGKVAFEVNLKQKYDVAKKEEAGKENIFKHFHN